MLKIIAFAVLATINCISFAHPEHAMDPPQDASDQPEHPSDHPELPSDHPEHPSDHPEHPSDHPEHPSDHPELPSETESSSIDETEVKKAKALLTEVHKVYKEADGINETVIVTYPNPMGETETFTVNLLVGKDSGSVTAIDQITFIWLGGKVIASIDEMKGGYVEADAPDGFLSGINAIISRGGGTPIWSIALRESDDYDQWVKSFDLFGLPEMPLLGITTKTEADKTVDVLEYGGEIARFEVTINEDRIISGIVANISQPGMPEMKISLASKTTFAKLSEPITFESGDLKKYDSFREMMMARMSDISQQEEDPDQPKSKLAGNPAPNFTLELMDGSGNVTLSDLKGQVVVLDFWATWCLPCTKGLPELNKFDEWAQEQGLKVQVFAVNIWERGDPDKISEKVKKFWVDNKYKTKVLMGTFDEKLAANYKISGIPVTAIIGTDGTIFEIHSGYRAGMDEKLKKSVQMALTSLDKPDHPEHPDHPDHPDHPSDHPDHPEHPSDHPDHPSDHPDHPN